MKTLSITLLMLMSISINSCKSKKSFSEKENNIAESKMEIKTPNYIKEGYSKATIVFDVTKNSPCDYLIQLDKGELLEPLTLEYKEFKVDKKLIWIKFVRQRRVSKCGFAQPMEIIDIKKRAK